MLKRLLKHYQKRYWTSESGLTILLIVLNVFLVLNMLGDYRFSLFLTRLFFSLVLIAGILTMFATPVVKFICIALTMVSVPLSWVLCVWPNRGLAALDAGLGVVYLGLLLAVVAAQVLRSGPVTVHRISVRGGGLSAPGSGVGACLYQLVVVVGAGGVAVSGQHLHRPARGASASVNLLQFCHPHHRGLR